MGDGSKGDPTNEMDEPRHDRDVDQSDGVLFADGPGLSFLKPDGEGPEDKPAGKGWRVLVVDDEPDILAITKLALSDFQFDGRPLELIFASSGHEGFDCARQYDDIAMAIVDVVMETEHAGLDLIRRIREELGNRMMRIVLRTGQPGTAPEVDVVSRYDIHDYKEKTELTTRKLCTLVFSSLRSYRDIRAIEQSKGMLETLLASSADLFKLQSFESLANRALAQIGALLPLGIGGLFAQRPIQTDADEQPFELVAGVGAFAQARGAALEGLLSGDQLGAVTRAVESGTRGLSTHRYVAAFSGERERVMLLEGIDFGHDVDQRIIDIFVQDIGVAIENIDLKNAIEETQRELLCRLGGAVETKSKETINHVKRVAAISHRFGLMVGLTPAQAEILRDASPMHDVGKIGIPDMILNKPGRLTEEEWHVMKGHALIGYNLLRGSGRPIIEAGALIALDHHEKWDGTGYPVGKSGVDISLYGRITAIVDVYDALLSQRCYKEPWPIEAVLSYLVDQKGRQFDPTLVDAFLDNVDEFQAISRRYPD